MSNSYAELYEKRRSYDPFSDREGIDCRTALEDIFAAFLGELIERITNGIPDWEKEFIYKQSIRKCRDALRAGKPYHPHMILSQKELNALLGVELRNCGGVSEGVLAAGITQSFTDLGMTLDGLVKLFDGFLLTSHNGQPYAVKTNGYCAPTSFQAIRTMSEKIGEMRNLSTHRTVNDGHESALEVYAKATAAYASIADALPVMGDLFPHFTHPADEDYLRDRYFPLLDRVLGDLKRKLSVDVIVPDGSPISYKDLGNYNLFLDESALSSGYAVTLNKLLDEMKVFVYADSFASIAKSTSNPDAMTKYKAKGALSGLRMYKEKAVLLQDIKENDQQSILETLRTHPDKKCFVVTENATFAKEILALGNPLQLAARIRNDRGEFTVYQEEMTDE